MDATKHSLMLFRPFALQIYSPQTTSAETTEDRFRPESCFPSYYLETVDLQVLRALGSLPRLDALPSPKSTGAFIGQDSAAFLELQSHYKLGKKFAKGGFGEIWRAVLYPTGIT